MKKLLILISLLLFCVGCVSRTTTATDKMTGGKQAIDKKIIWIWDEEF